MATAAAQKVIPITQDGKSAKQGAESRKTVLEHASNELVFAVVGHVGSGTSEIAKSLQALLAEKVGIEKAPEIHVIKATDIISEWAASNGKTVPQILKDGKKTLATVESFQDLGDQLRNETNDNAAVAKRFAIRIRELRAKSQSIDASKESAIVPNGEPRAFILDSIRHPAEVELLRHIYQDAFVLLGIVCEEKVRADRVSKKYSDASRDDALTFMARDAKAAEKYGQRVSDAFHLADYFIDNTVNRYKDDGHANDDWDINEKLSRLIKILRHSEVVRPELSETAMAHAHNAALRSACLSRQVGAALTDRSGNLVATGCNEVPRAGGGLYGDVFDADHHEDHRCAYRSIEGQAGPFCSNTKTQNDIIDKVIDAVAAIKTLEAPERSLLAKSFRAGPIGALLESVELSMRRWMR